ncbi:MAG: flagellar assembly protein FliW [Planctomycetota bacterium]
MQIKTTRFGPIEVPEADVLSFAQGLIGMEDCRRWIILADAQNPALAWLQSAERADLALAVVSPRRFVPDYQVRVSGRDVAGLGLGGADGNAPSGEAKDAQVVVVVNKTPEGLAVNLKAPIVVCLATKSGRQIIAKDDHAVQYVLGATVPFRRSA